MKQKLKVGDYAEVITDVMDEKGKVGEITNIIHDGKYPIRIKFDQFDTSVYVESELRKVSPPFGMMPPMNDLEQHLTSLGVYLQFVDHFYTDMSMSDYGTIKEYLRDKEWQYSTRETLTEILTP